MNESDKTDNFLRKDKKLLSSDSLDYAIKNLSRPRFLGSIHLKNNANPSFKHIENLIDKDLNLKMTKSLRNTILNPVTKTLIILAIIFNIFWFLLVYLI